MYHPPREEKKSKTKQNKAKQNIPNEENKSKAKQNKIACAHSPAKKSKTKEGKTL